jgi:probable phosphoglycerate mutase
MNSRRRLLLMRHGSVEYFDSDGRPFPPHAVPLTPQGETQARAMGAALAAAGVRIDRAITSGLLRTRQTAAAVLQAAAVAPPIEHWEDLQEIRPGHLPSIPPHDLRAAFLGAFGGPAPRQTRFLEGESIGELLDRVLPALRRLLAADDWDTALAVLHGGVNRALLSWFLTGEATFLGGLEQDPGCLNIIDVGGAPCSSARECNVRVVNFCALDPLQTTTRLSTMEHLLERYLAMRARDSGSGGSET